MNVFAFLCILGFLLLDKSIGYDVINERDIDITDSRDNKNAESQIQMICHSTLTLPDGLSRSFHIFGASLGNSSRACEMVAPILTIPSLFETRSFAKIQNHVASIYLYDNIHGKSALSQDFSDKYDLVWDWRPTSSEEVVNHIVHLYPLVKHKDTTLVIGRGRFLQQFEISNVDVFVFGDRYFGLTTFPFKLSSNFFEIDENESLRFAEKDKFSGNKVKREIVINASQASLNTNSHLSSMVLSMHSIEPNQRSLDEQTASNPPHYRSIWQWLSGVLIAGAIAMTIMTVLGCWLARLQVISIRENHDARSRKEFGYVDENGVISLGEMDEDGIIFDSSSSSSSFSAAASPFFVERKVTVIDED